MVKITLDLVQRRVNNRIGQLRSLLMSGDVDMVTKNQATREHAFLRALQSQLAGLLSAAIELRPFDENIRQTILWEEPEEDLKNLVGEITKTRDLIFERFQKIWDRRMEVRDFIRYIESAAEQIQLGLTGMPMLNREALEKLHEHIGRQLVDIRHSICQARNALDSQSLAGRNAEDDYLDLHATAKGYRT